MAIPPPRGRAPRSLTLTTSTRAIRGGPADNVPRGSVGVVPNPPDLSNVPAMPNVPAQTILPLPNSGALPGKCYRNASRIVAERGGRLAFGWALADHGPLLLRKRPQEPLYSRWINHVVWRDDDGRLWEVTPYCEVGDHQRTGWLPTRFLLDPDAAPRICDDGMCDVWPARYFALRREGQAVVHCLNRLHIDGPWHEVYWLERSMRELEIVGLAPAYWRVERVAGRLNNVWLFAE